MSQETLLQIQNLKVNVGETEILHGIDLDIQENEVHVLPDNERAKKGIFLSFQNPIEIPGITVSAFIRSAVEAKTGKRVRFFSFKKELEEKMELLQMDPSYAERDLNEKFSAPLPELAALGKEKDRNPANADAASGTGYFG